eukprot:7636635-Lingulodinium_polyedra.AAC.1
MLPGCQTTRQSATGQTPCRCSSRNATTNFSVKRAGRGRPPAALPQLGRGLPLWAAGRDAAKMASA